MTSNSQTQHNTGDVGQSARGPLLRVIRSQKTAFLVVGLVNTVVGLVLFAVFDRLLGKDKYLLSLLGMHVVSVCIAFVLYRYLVFRVRGNLLRDAIRFETVYLSGLAVNAIVLVLAVDVAHWPPMAAQVVIVILAAVWSWVGHGRFSFKRPAANPAEVMAPAAPSTAAVAPEPADSRLGTDRPAGNAR